MKFLIDGPPAGIAGGWDAENLCSFGIHFGIPSKERRFSANSREEAITRFTQLLGAANLQNARREHEVALYHLYEEVEP